MEKTVTLNLRVNPVVKQNAEEILKQLGISMSTAVDMYLRQINLKGGIPFPVTIQAASEAVNADAMTNEQLHAAINEGYEAAKTGNLVEAHAAFEAFREAHK